MKSTSMILSAALAACAFVAFGSAATPPDQPVLVDTSASAGGVFASSSSSATFTAAKAFDGAWSEITSDRWLAYTSHKEGGETPMYVIYKFNTPTKVSVLRLRIPSDSNWEQRSPKDWTFSGSNDGVSWTTLDTRSDVSWTAGEVKTVSFTNGTAYEYYKFNCTAVLLETSDYMQIYEIQFLYDGFSEDITDLTTPTSGAVSDCSASSQTSTAAKAFDGNRNGSGGRWLAAATNSDMYVVYHFNTATNVNAIRIWNGDDSNGCYNSSGRAPKAWTFSGSNDGAVWTPLVARTDETGWSANGESRYYSFYNETAYAYYKFNCTELDGATDWLQICELEFYNIPQDGPDPTALVYSSELTFPAAPAAALANFPVLVRISQTTIDGFLYDACPDSSHLWFTDANGTLLPFEVDSWNASGTSLVWVSVPSLSNSATITMHWAGDTANVPDEIPASREVWTRAGYRAVWHFSGSAAESVTNLAATAVGSPTYNGNASYPGPLGKTLWLNGSSHLYFANNPSWATIGENSTLTISCWARATAGNYARMISSMSDWKNTTGYELTTQSSSSEITVGSSGTGSNGSQFQTQIAPGVNTAWQHFTATYSGTTATLYVNGASAKSATLNPVVAPTQGLALGSISGTTGSNLWTGGLDEVRIRAAASTAAWIAEECATMTNAAYVSYGKATADASAPVVATPVVTRDAGGGFTVTVGISQNVPTSVCCVVGNVTNVMTTSDSELPMTYSATLSGLAADTTCACVVSAASTGGSVVLRACPAKFYTGDIAVEKISDAAEDGLVPGVFRIARTDTAYDLPIAYTVGGTATAGQTYEPLSGTAIIPAGTNSIDIVVVPILDQQTTSNTTVTITLDAGLYGIDAEAYSAELTIANLVAPAGFNLWVAPSNGLASVGTNWSEGHTPTQSENVLFDGRFSIANCEWDAGAIVASWTQTNGYTGTVTFDTEFPDYSGATFTLFTISGDCGIYSGKWSCRGNYNNFGAEKPSYTYKTDKRWCLNVFVGGAMQVASGASITATGCGFGFPNDKTSASKSYGGYGYGGTEPYGSIKEPFDPGMGARAQGDQNGKISAIGGGAIKIAVTGALTLDGSIVALGTIDQNVIRAGGTGGSIWIVAAQISGTGTIDASACPRSYFMSDLVVGVPSGGRVALYTQSPLALPIANVTCNGTSFKGSKAGGPGTIYVYDSTQTSGTLYVKQSTDISTINSRWTAAPVMGDLALDAVVLSGYAQLRIPTGASLALPSLAAVSTDNSDAGRAGLVVAGGSLDMGSGNQTLKANVAFAPVSDFAFPGDLTLESGARLGNLLGTSGSDAADFDTTYTVSVAGDLTIPAGASAGASTTAGGTASNKARYAASHGGQSLYLAVGARTNGFDSVLNPSMPGGSAKSAFPAGGVFTLTVGGTLTLDGAMRANGGEARGSTSTYDGTSAGAGGTVNVTAGALAGTGVITADGGCGRYNYAGGAGGGRVAVRLTGSGSTFSDWWTTNVFARGESFASDNGKASSAGTVYLQEAANGEAGGLVVIRNDLAIQAAAANNNATTRYPGNGDGCDTPAALKKTSLLVAGAAHVELTDTMRSAALEIESGSSIDLAGKVFTVNAAKLGERRFATGKYMAGDDAVAGFITDSVGGGMLVISGGGFKLLVR